MSLIKESKKTIQKEGLHTFVKKSIRYLKNKIIPQPTVSNKSTCILLWYLKYIYNIWFEINHGKGIDVFDEDWDTLILLDACRYDDFNDVNHIPGDLSSKISKGVDSDEFIRKNFVGKNHLDTVYVTANPHVGLIDKNTFHNIITEPISNWDSELQCVPPKQVTSSAIKAHRQYPNKRIIVHYMQPHDPPLGPTANKIRKKFEIGGAAPGNNSLQGKRIMELVASGDISERKAHCAYRETLKIVLEEVSSLLEHIDGKIVISSDHGEMFGEKPYALLGKLYEHYQNPKTKELCKIPWFVVESPNSRREINLGNSAQSSKDTDSSMLNEQLKALGYK